MVSIRLQKQRERWENQITIAAEHEKLMKKNFQRYVDQREDIIKRYKKWLETRKVEPCINLDHYK